MLFFGFGISIFSTEIGIKRGYQFAHLFLDDISGHGRDLGFNLYDGNINKSYKESQIDKYKYISAHLGLKPGMKILDCGCGYGDWLNYCKTKLNLSECVGINISPEQSNFARKHYGIEIYNCNWKEVLTDPELQKALYDRFDVITFFDTVEHYVSSQHRNNNAEIAKVYTSMFKMAHNLLNPDSKLQKIFISCLHQNKLFVGKSFGILGKISSYFLVRYHSGYYPKGKDGLTRYSTNWFGVVQQDDKTEDYRLTAVLDKKQFQAPKVQWNFRTLYYALILFILDPHHIHKWIDIYMVAWMNLYGDDVYSKEYNVEKRAKSSIVLLWWITFQNKRLNMTN